MLSTYIMVQLLREENLGPGQYFPRIRCGKAVRTFRRKIGTSFLFFFCFWFFGGAEGDLLFFETAAFGLVMVLIEL